MHFRFAAKLKIFSAIFLAVVCLWPKEFILARDLRQGNRGEDVKKLQIFLKNYGVYGLSSPVTGYFGPITQRAVNKFQAIEKIKAGGKVEKKTRARMRYYDLKSKQTISHQATTSTPLPDSNVGENLPKIYDIALSDTINENGKTNASTTSFTSSTKNIFAILSLKNTKLTTKLGYIRYYKNSYVDSGVSHPSANDLNYFHFQWSLKPGTKRLAGNYTLVFYIDGKKSISIDYEIH